MSNVSQVLSTTNLTEVTSDKQATLGTRGATKDGRRFVYAKAGATTLAPGKLVVAADADANVVNKAVTADSSIGSKTVKITAGGAVAENAYADGILQVNDATGEGTSYRITGNTAGTSGNSYAVVVTLDDAIEVALAKTVSEVSLYKADSDGVVISATDQADLAVGVPLVSIPANNYGWLQTYGPSAVLADEAVNRGLELTIGTGVAGAVEAVDALGEQVVGVASQALIDTEYSPVFLKIA